MTERTLHVVAGVVAVAMHAGLAGGVWGMNWLDRAHVERRARLADASHVTIEAGLAIKSKTAEGKKSSLPSKDVAPKVRPPDVRGVASDPEAAPSPNNQDTPIVPPSMVDPRSVFDKYRNLDTTGESTTGAAGGDDQNVAGSPDGSEWGTVDDAKGDPYVGELVGRMTTNPELMVPTVVTDSGLETLGCVRLDPDGRISERSIDKENKSRNATFNRAVEERLKATTDMDEPVPAHLHDLLVKRGICVPYRY